MEKKRWLVLAGTLAAGVALHFLYDWLPNPLVAVFSAVNESLWEHTKLIFWPLLGAGMLLAGKDGAGRAAWRLGAVISALAMLGVAYVYHVVFGGEWLVFDLGLYAAAILLGFVLPGKLWTVGERAWGRWLGRAAALLMAGALVWFTFFPPEGVLFADLSAVRTFLTIPV